MVEAPNPSARSDLGTRVFGGDPFWVGEMGRAYVAGLHEGSNDRMVVVAKHFPGRGSSDRLPEEEVATVRKSLDQLKQIELPPFFEVTNSDESANIVDGLLVSHIRYQGFQGNIRATTRPVSFDASALPAILALPEFTTWRANGGLIVSDALGSDAVRDFYSQQGTENFSPRLVARDAFNAGNDLLYLGNITSDSEEGDTYSATLEIVEFFAQEYRNDLVFARRVDMAVLRILEQKLRMYDLFVISNVLAPDINSADLGNSDDAETQRVLSSFAKQRRELIEAFRKGGREDLATAEEAGLKIVESYLPKALGEAEVRAAVMAVIAETGASSRKDLGLVMKAAMARLQGTADGKLVNRFASELLP